MEEHECPARSYLYGIIGRAIPMRILDTQYLRAEIYRQVYGRIVVRNGLYERPRSLIPYFDLTRQSNELLPSILDLEAIFCQGLNIWPGAPVKDRYLDIVNLNDGIVNPHPEQGRHEMLYGRDACFPR